MSEFEKGQIVYVSDNGEYWKVTHYARANDNTETLFTYGIHDNYTQAIKGCAFNKYRMCVSVEDYHRLLKQPKDKDLVWAWSFPFVKHVGFYDAKHKCVFMGTGHRAGVDFDNYEVIPREQWPEWAVEAYELLAD